MRVADAVVRAATRADLPAIATIHSDGWHESYAPLVSPATLARVTPAARLASWTRWFDAGGQQLYVLDTAAGVSGFCRLSAPQPVADPPSGHGELTHLYLDPPWIGEGAGHCLFTFATHTLQASGCTGMLLWTLEGNARARRFYQRHGMHTDGARKDEPDWLGPGVFEVRYRLSLVD